MRTSMTSVTAEVKTRVSRVLVVGAGFAGLNVARGLGGAAGFEVVVLDRQGRVLVREDLSVPERPEVFVLGDLARVDGPNGPLPGVAPVAMQQGRYLARMRVTGFLAWIMWLVVHIYYLSGFRNRLLVLIQWAWSYLTFARGARLIVEKDWRSHAHEIAPACEAVVEPVRTL